MTRHAARFRANTRRLGERVAVHNYEAGTRDMYEDERPVERADSPHESVPCSFRTADRADEARDASGVSPDSRLTALLPGDHAAVEYLAGGHDEAPRSNIVRPSGERLAVVNATTQGNGLVEATVQVVGGRSFDDESDEVDA